MPAPIAIQVSGRNPDETRQFAGRIDGLVDASIQQSGHYPELRFGADRTRINQLDLTEGDITTSIAGTVQTAPLYWLDPHSMVTYPVAVQMPQYRISSLADNIIGLPVTGLQPARCRRPAPWHDYARHDLTGRGAVPQRRR